MKTRLIRALLTGTALVGFLLPAGHHQPPAPEAVRTAVVRCAGHTPPARVARLLAHIRAAHAQHSRHDDVPHIELPDFETRRLGTASYSITGTAAPSTRFIYRSVAAIRDLML